jgi:glycosidase
MENIFVAIIGNIEDAKEAIRNAGYDVGDYTPIDEEYGNLEVDEDLVEKLEREGDIEENFNGTIITAEWPW